MIRASHQQLWQALKNMLGTPTYRSKKKNVVMRRKRRELYKHVPTFLQPTLLYIFIDSLIWLLLFYHSNFNVCIYNGQYLLFLYSAASYLRRSSQNFARPLRHQIRISNAHIQNRIKYSHRFFSRRLRVRTWRNTRCERMAMRTHIIQRLLAPFFLNLILCLVVFMVVCACVCLWGECEWVCSQSANIMIVLFYGSKWK